MKTVPVGVSARHVLVSVDGRGVIVNPDTFDARLYDLEGTEGSARWSAPSRDQDYSVAMEIAQCLVASVDDGDETTAKRLFTVPKGVQEQARDGLTLHLESGSGASAVAIRAAALLASGQQVTLARVHQVARYFAARGPGDPVLSYSTVGDQLWGGDAGAAWAVKATQGTATSVDMLLASVYPDDVTSLYGDDNDDGVCYEVWAKLDESDCVTELYRCDNYEYDDEWSLWDNGGWAPCDAYSDPHADGLVELDSDTALLVAAGLHAKPEVPVFVGVADLDEWDMVSQLLPGVDFELINRAIIDDMPETDFAVGDPTPGDYTPEERSQSASRQVRDKYGKFAKTGSRVTVVGRGANGGGFVSKVLPDTQEVEVALDSGENVTMPAGMVITGPDAPQEPQIKLDLSGILAQPRAVSTTPQALLPYRLPVMDSEAIKNVIADYQGFIDEERRKNAAKFDVLTPDTSDVEPIYLALVAPDDPLAVTDLVALVPASTTSSEPTTYKRSEGKWVADPKILQDLNGATPPPVVALDDDTYKAVLSQVDQFVVGNGGGQPPAPATSDGQPTTASVDLEELVTQRLTPIWGPNGEIYRLVAAGVPGIADTPSDTAAARRLREYWVHGRGAEKIRWGLHAGAYRRCVRHLSKYVGPRSHGLCAVYFHEATGVWPGSQANRGRG